MEGLVEVFHGLTTSHKLICVVSGGVAAVVAAVVIRKLLQREKRIIFPKDTAILHQIGRGPHAPSMGSFAVKLETYLRMARIPYQNVFGLELSSKGKFPWMEYNGEAVADSSLCIDFLNKKLDIDLNKHLRPAERGIAQSMQVMLEEHLYWILMIFRWQFETEKSMMDIAFRNASYFFRWSLKRSMLKSTWAQGLGRHNKGEIIVMMKKDMQCISGFLGEKRYLMGDEPCEADCAVFGQLCQFHWQFLGTGHENLVKDKYPNLAAYCDRMKTTFWPDWDQCITHGGTREATK